MIAYLDTSAVAPIVVAEPSTPVCRRIWTDADRRVSCRPTYVEMAAALTVAARQGRLTAAAHRSAWAGFLTIWSEVDVVDLSSRLAESAADLARTEALRGYDAVHAAAALAVADDDLVAVSGDAALLGVWGALGLAVLDTNGPTS